MAKGNEKPVLPCSWHCCQFSRVENFSLCANHLRLERAWGRAELFRLPKEPVDETLRKTA